MHIGPLCLYMPFSFMQAEDLDCAIDGPPYHYRGKARLENH